MLTGVAGGAAGVLTRQPDYAPNLLQGVRAKRATDQYKRQIENLARAWQIPVPQGGFPATTRITDLIAMLPQYQPVAGVGLVEEQLGQAPRVAVPAVPPDLKSPEAIIARADLHPDNPEYQAQKQRALQDYAQLWQAKQKPERPIAVKPGQQLYQPGKGTFTQVPGAEGAAVDEKYMNTPISADTAKNITWWTKDGKQIRPAKGITRGVALGMGGTALSKEDTTKMRVLKEVEEDMSRMADLTPKVAPLMSQTDFVTLAGMAVSQTLRDWRLDRLAKQNPDAAEYLQRMRTTSLNLTKTKLPIGRLPVFDQKLLMGLFVTGGQTPQVQQSQLRRLSDAARLTQQDLVGGGEPASTRGPITVRRKSDGQLGTLDDEGEFDPNLYERVQ